MEVPEKQTFEIPIDSVKGANVDYLVEVNGVILHGAYSCDAVFYDLYENVACLEGKYGVVEASSQEHGNYLAMNDYGSSGVAYLTKN